MNIITTEYEHALNMGMAPETVLGAIASLFHEPYTTTDKDGVVVERNRYGFIQMKIMQSVADKLWDHMHNPTLRKPYWAEEGSAAKEPSGLRHRIDRKRAYVRACLNRGDREDYIERQAEQVARMQDEYDYCEAVYMAAAAMFEHVTGNDYRPWEPWNYKAQSKGNVETQKGGDEEPSPELLSKLAAAGIEWTPPPAANNTDGVDTNETAVA